MVRRPFSFPEKSSMPNMYRTCHVRERASAEPIKNSHSRAACSDSGNWLGAWFLPRRERRGRGTMRSMVEGADTSVAAGIRPLHRLRRSPSPAPRVRNRPTPRYVLVLTRREFNRLGTPPVAPIATGGNFARMRDLRCRPPGQARRPRAWCSALCGARFRCSEESERLRGRGAWVILYHAGVRWQDSY